MNNIENIILHISIHIYNKYICFGKGKVDFIHRGIKFSLRIRNVFKLDNEKSIIVVIIKLVCYNFFVN